MARKTNIEINGIKYFQIYPTITLPDGTKVRKKFYGTGKEDAIRQKEQYEKDLQDGVLDPSETTMGSILKHWVYSIIRLDSTIKASSFERYEGIYRNYLKDSEIASMRLTSIDKKTVKSFYNRLFESAGLTKSQIQNIHKVLRKFFYYAIDHNMIQSNPCSKVAIPGEKEYGSEKIEIFTDDEINKIITSLEGNPNKFLVSFAFGTGMRLGELIALRHQDIKDGNVHVSYTLSEHSVIDGDGNSVRVAELQIPKSKSSVRAIPLPRSVLDQYIPGEPGDFVFTNANGNMIDKSNFRKQWEKILKKADVPYRKFHSTRHTYITRLLQKGAKIVVVKELAGHSEISMTMRYTHIGIDDKYEAVGLLDQIPM